MSVLKTPMLGFVTTSTRLMSRKLTATRASILAGYHTPRALVDSYVDSAAMHLPNTHFCMYVLTPTSGFTQTTAWG